MMALLEMDNLHVAYKMRGQGVDGGVDQWVDVVRGISLSLNKGETFGIVGESGCGKSTVAFAVMNYLGAQGKISKGHIYFEGRDLPLLSEVEARGLRGKKIAMVYQNPLSSLNPAMRIGRQIGEVLEHHHHLSPPKAYQRSLAILEKVHMPDPASVMKRYPHQLSGGMQQRVVIAMALISNPDLLIMDEPTTGLDVTTEAAVLDLVNELKAEFNSAILYISHNLGVIAKVCDRVGVMYAGQFVETGQVQTIFKSPSHPYAQDLLACLPRLDWHYQRERLQAIEGQVPLASNLPKGCVFAPRCRYVQEDCLRERPELRAWNDRSSRCLQLEAIAQRRDCSQRHGSGGVDGFKSRGEGGIVEARATSQTLPLQRPTAQSRRWHRPEHQKRRNLRPRR
ncbi:MAG: ABC transporter ATP-binding protein [Deinococcales bacterium]